jgi:hypothetical protein
MNKLPNDVAQLRAAAQGAFSSKVDWSTDELPKMLTAKFAQCDTLSQKLIQACHEQMQSNSSRPMHSGGNSMQKKPRCAQFSSTFTNGNFSVFGY